MTVEFVTVYGMEGSLGGSGMGRRFEILLTKPVQRDIIIVSFSKEGNV
jgi:hypothetical protein